MKAAKGRSHRQGKYRRRTDGNGQPIYGEPRQPRAAWRVEQAVSSDPLAALRPPLPVRVPQGEGRWSYTNRQGVPIPRFVDTTPTKAEAARLLAKRENHEGLVGLMEHYEERLRGTGVPQFYAPHVKDEGRWVRVSGGALFLERARKVFANVMAALEGRGFEVELRPTREVRDDEGPRNLARLLSRREREELLARLAEVGA